MVFQYCFSFRPCCEQPMPFSLFFSLVVTHSFLLSVCLTSLPAVDKISIFINVFKYLDWALQNVFLKISAFPLIFTFLHELWGFICSSSLAFWRRKLLVLTWLKENIHYSCACTRTSFTTLQLTPWSFNAAVAYETGGWSIILPSAWTVSFLYLMASIVGFASFAVEKLGTSFLFSVYLGCYISTARFDPPNSSLVFTVFQWWALLSIYPVKGFLCLWRLMLPPLILAALLGAYSFASVSSTWYQIVFKWNTHLLCVTESDFQFWGTPFTL